MSLYDDNGTWKAYPATGSAGITQFTQMLL